MFNAKLLKLDKLHVFRDVVEETWKDLDEDPRKELILALGSMFRKPLVEFESAYDQFIDTIQKFSGRFDRWLNVQVQILTSLEEHGDALTQFVQMYEEILEGTDGGEVGKVQPESWDDISFVLALAMRVYGDGLTYDAIVNDPGVKDGDE